MLLPQWRRLIGVDVWGDLFSHGAQKHARMTVDEP